MEGENFKSGSEGSFLRQRLPKLPANPKNGYLAPDGGGKGGKPSWKKLPIPDAPEDSKLYVLTAQNGVIEWTETQDC